MSGADERRITDFKVRGETIEILGSLEPSDAFFRSTDRAEVVGDEDMERGEVEDDNGGFSEELMRAIDDVVGGCGAAPSDDDSEEELSVRRAPWRRE